MNKWIVAGLALLSFNAFSQSYVVLHNGVTLTTDKSGFVYDFGHFNLPYKVTNQGGQFFFENEKLSTIDAGGYLYEKDIELEKLKGKGLNYFFSPDNTLYTIDEKGFVYEFEDDLEEGFFYRVSAFGGNYFIVKPETKKKPFELYTVSSAGKYSRIDVPGLTVSDIIVSSGTYFQTKFGAVYTVSKDGFVFPKTELKVGVIKKSGGNYFIDSAGKLFTVSEEGFLLLPILPANLFVTKLQKFGANYMIDVEGRLFIVDKSGVIHERSMPFDLKNSKVLSL